MNRAALARMPACSGARRVDHAEPMVLDFPRTRAYPCYYNRVIVVLILIKSGDVWMPPLKGGHNTAAAPASSPLLIKSRVKSRDVQYTAVYYKVSTT